MDRRTFLAGAAAAAAAPVARSAMHGRPVVTGPHILGASPAAHADGDNARGAQDSRPLFGAMVTPEDLKDPELVSLVTRTCDVVVMAGGVVWRSVEPTQDVLDFRRSESILRFATANNMVIRGHNLVDHASIPQWVLDTATKDTAQRLLERHINTMMARFKGQISYWDVLNEVIVPSAPAPERIRDDFWFRNCGTAYIPASLRVARAADPSARIGYNEYGLEDDSALADAKREAVLHLLRGLKSDGAPIDYLGIQAHLQGRATYSKAKLGAFLANVANLGIRVLITELDVDDRAFPAEPGARDRLVADTYRRFLDVAFDAAPIDMVTCWGLSDRASWPQQQTPRRDGALQRSLPFDKDLRPKAAWQVLVDKGWKQKRPHPAPA